MADRALRINAFVPDVSNSSALSRDWDSWATRQLMQPRKKLLDFADAPDPRDWRNPKVGWGVVLPEDERLSEKDRALPTGLPDAVCKTIRDRDGVILRYRADIAPEKIARYYAADGRRQDCHLVGSDPGIGVGELPMYLLILASPEKIPWKQQYIMAGSRIVGRLDLPVEALENYFLHLANNWKGSAAKPRAPVVWSVDWEGDITALLRRMVAEPTYDAYKNDTALDPFFLHDVGATDTALIEALVSRRPGVIVTTSHGSTGPLNDVTALVSTLGMPVDQNRKLLNLKELLAAWQPDGAIWYAHACCSAGSDAETSYAGLFDPNGDIDRILRGVMTAGSRVAPLPTALLCANQPARAFVGHVEPTFDWPLQDPETGQPLGLPFSDALTTKLYATSRHPIGSAFQAVHALASDQFKLWYQAKEEAQREKSAATRRRKREMALRAQLGGLDWQGVVILGDPTVAVAQS
jgi:hypothetical protein